MNPLNSIRNLFKKKSQELTEEDNKFNEAFNEYQEGKKLYSAKKYQDAIYYFDRAIESGFERYYNEIYELRAISLQTLQFDLDAIEDFNKAISLAPEDANLFFMRGLSRGATGDFIGSIFDYKEAIRLSKIDNNLNDHWNNYAKETGWTSVSAVYEHHLVRAQMNKDLYEKHPDAWERRMEKHPLHRRNESST